MSLLLHSLTNTLITLQFCFNKALKLIIIQNPMDESINNMSDSYYRNIRVFPEQSTKTTQGTMIL